MKKTKKYQATRRLRKENEYKGPLSSPVPRTMKKSLETLFSLTLAAFALISYKSDTSPIRLSIKSDMSLKVL